MRSVKTDVESEVSDKFGISSGIKQVKLQTYFICLLVLGLSILALALEFTFKDCSWVKTDAESRVSEKFGIGSIIKAKSNVKLPSTEFF